MNCTPFVRQYGIVFNKWFFCILEKNKRKIYGDIAFAKGDNLQIEYHLEQTVRSGKLSTTYIITKVLTTLRNHKQTKLNLEHTSRGCVLLVFFVYVNSGPLSVCRIFGL